MKISNVKAAYKKYSLIQRNLSDEDKTELRALLAEVNQFSPTSMPFLINLIKMVQGETLEALNRCESMERKADSYCQNLERQTERLRDRFRGSEEGYVNMNREIKRQAGKIKRLYLMCFAFVVVMTLVPIAVQVAN